MSGLKNYEWRETINYLRRGPEYAIIVLKTADKDANRYPSIWSNGKRHRSVYWEVFNELREGGVIVKTGESMTSEKWTFNFEKSEQIKQG